MKRIAKIVLVEPKAPGYHVYSGIALPRLGLPLIAAILKRAGYLDVKLYVEDLAPIDYADLCSADLVGISSTTSTALAAYRIGSYVKQHSPNTTVLLGGVHVTFMPQEPFDSVFCARNGLEMPVCDHVVRGEGEGLILDLIRAIENGESPEPILGAPMREHIVCGLHRPELDTLPFPDLSCIVGRERIGIAPIATSRGCPFDCLFCSVIEMFGRKMRYRSIDPQDPASVIAEIKQLHADRMSSVFFYDDNFIADIRRAKQLLENLIRADAVPRAWTAQVRATEVVRDRELLALMRRTNCTMVYMGLESVNPESLIEFNKKQSVEQIVEAIRVLREYGIHAHGMFVMGADADTVQTVRATADFAIKNNVSTVQFMILTPLPGTRYFQRLDQEERIFDFDWSHYDAHHTVFWPKHLSPYALQAETMEAMRRIYRLPRAAVAALRGDIMAAYLRMKAHTLVAGFMEASASYMAALPRTMWSAS